jgi:pyruvate,water dikinase
VLLHPVGAAGGRTTHVRACPLTTQSPQPGSWHTYPRRATPGRNLGEEFHVTTESYRQFVAEHGLQEQVLAAVRNAGDAAARRTAKLFTAHLIPAEGGDAIRRAYAALSSGKDVAVASADWSAQTP